MTHGLVCDLVSRLEKDPHELPVLGDGRQRKPYGHVTECVEGMLFAVARSSNAVNLFNLISDSTVDALYIARTVAQALGLDPDLLPLRFTAGPEGWPA